MELVIDGVVIETRVVCDPKYGYLRIDPIPTQEEMDEYYKSVYFKEIEKGSRAPEICRQKIGGEEARLELEWLSKTLYKDIIDTLGVYVKAKRLLDIGCGTGEFLKYAKDNGWEAIGVEPSKEGGGMARSLGVKVFNMTLEEFPEYKQREFNAIALLNVLEHVPDPAGVLLTAKKLLNPDGIVCIRVPNDFSVLQEYAEKKLNKGQWWVIIPDHINYFNFESLQKLLEDAGFDVLHQTTDFPMELFLLMGDDYVGNLEVGSECHRKRRNFEMSITNELRRNIYDRFATIGVGRSCIMFARARS